MQIAPLASELGWIFVRDLIARLVDMPKEDIEKLVMASEVVKKCTEGKAPKKVIIVQGKIVNVVL